MRRVSNSTKANSRNIRSTCWKCWLLIWRASSRKSESMMRPKWTPDRVKSLLRSSRTWKKILSTILPWPKSTRKSLLTKYKIEMRIWPWELSRRKVLRFPLIKKFHQNKKKTPKTNPNIRKNHHQTTKNHRQTTPESPRVHRHKSKNRPSKRKTKRKDSFQNIFERKED